MSDTLLRGSIAMLERGMIPETAVRFGIRRLCRQRLIEIEHASTDAFATTMVKAPVAPVPEKANEQHYELPASFFELALGSHRKYSSCYWPKGATSLDEAEARALEETCGHADLHDGQRVLELGCGWGSLTLWMAERYPGSSITAVSNSASQREHIESEAQRRGLDNVRVITADMNEFRPDQTFDRIVSVEMFEHMRNWRELLGRIHDWLADDGRLFIHVFCHRTHPYAFEVEGVSDWLGRYFFTGGIMPSVELLGRVAGDYEVEAQWTWDGTHYQRTAEAWLWNLDRNRAAVMPILEEAYGDEAGRWFNRWRVFFLACAELFGYANGREWLVAHYRLAKRTATISG